MKICKYKNCNNEFDGRKHFCSEQCKWRHNSIKREEEKHLPPVRKRNKNYFWKAINVYWDRRGQGKRSGHMVMGSMAARVDSLLESVTEFTEENVREHFAFRYGAFTPSYTRMGDGERMAKKECEDHFKTKF